MATQTEVTIGEPGWFESDRPGEGGELYYVVGSFIPDENGPHIIENSAEEGETMWVVDVFDVESDVVWITHLLWNILWQWFDSIGVYPLEK